MSLLQENANVSNKEIAVATKLTLTPVYERIKKLEKEDVIKIKTTELTAQKFENFIEVNGKVEALKDVDVSPVHVGLTSFLFMLSVL